jgi:uncharacterized protein
VVEAFAREASIVDTKAAPAYDGGLLNDSFTPMRATAFFLALLAFSTTTLAQSRDAKYVEELNTWRVKADTSLRRDTGWLTLAGRWELKLGVNKIGAAKDNDIVFPEGVAPDYFGEVQVAGTQATLKLNAGYTMRTEQQGGEEFSERVMESDAAKMKWLHRDRLALTTFKHPAGKMILRIADQENIVRKNFQGRMWFDVATAMNVPATFVAYPAGKKQKIVNVLGEITDEEVAGRLEFVVNGRKVSFDALGEPKDKELFIIFNDQTASTDGNGSYPAGRFLVVNRPAKGSNKTTVDFNRAYNPPCAFSAYTSCPLPPEQNQLKVKISAGEKYRG